MACVLVLEDQYSHIVPFTAKEGKIQFGVTKNQFSDHRYHATYGPSKRGYSMLTQWSKLASSANCDMQQVSSMWNVQFFYSFLFALTNLLLD